MGPIYLSIIHPVNGLSGAFRTCASTLCTGVRRGGRRIVWDEPILFKEFKLTDVNLVISAVRIDAAVALLPTSRIRAGLSCATWTMVSIAFAIWTQAAKTRTRVA